MTVRISQEGTHCFLLPKSVRITWNPCHFIDENKETSRLTVRSEKNRLISHVQKNSIAANSGVMPGDILLAIDGKEVLDVFDYRMRAMTDHLTLTILRADSSRYDVKINKEDEEDVGLLFEEPLLDTCSSCANHCMFCFIDQLPRGLRPSLYFKDDDLRMSFLTGNYVTLTNLPDAEFDRILSYHLSPMNVSVHATDPDVRSKMMNNRSAGNLMERLVRITESGISLNCQIVLCPGLNDGDVLERTLTDLSKLGGKLNSIAVVPVGITKYREKNQLPVLASFTKQTATGVLDQVQRWQNKFLQTRNERIFFAADEFYLRAEKEIPPPSHYEGFPQLENGVGMISEFCRQMKTGIARRGRRNMSIGTRNDGLTSRIMVLSGIDAAPTLKAFAEPLSVLYNITLDVLAIDNHFFGEQITVTGLLTGQDIVEAFEKWKETRAMAPDLVLLPDCMLKSDEDILLDDMTVDTLRQTLSVPIQIVRANGDGLLDALDEYTKIQYIKNSRSNKRGVNNDE
jgi:putative radical SAM enzyme (TIGR03279 family)